MTRRRPNRTRRSVFFTLLAATCAVAAVYAPSAAADSLTFIKNNNVWLANPDGSGQYQVTLDGTASAPYESPSQSDNGTVVAIRQTPGQRRQIYRMTQSGQLLNPPINTPAPGTGAIDARVSPDGQLVAYWFVTQVSTGTCLFCWDLANQVLISHSDRFTNPAEVGTPNTGSVPSWMSNDTLLLSNGSAQELYYRLGMSEAADWWGDADNCDCLAPGDTGPLGLTDGEVSRDGQRIAVVRGDSQELIWLYSTNGAPPAVPTPQCEIHDPTGRFHRPTWSQNGQTLAWQEDDGIWSGPIPDLANCLTLNQSRLIVPGGSEPDLSPAAVNPGPRPACGNPGNPAACVGAPPPPPHTTTPPPPHQPPQPPPPPCGACALGASLQRLATNVTRALGRVKIAGLLRAHQLTARFTAPAAGTLTARLTATGTTARRTTLIATGRRVYKAAGTGKLTIKLTPQGSKQLRHSRRLRATLTARFAPQGGRAISTTSTARLKR